MCANTIVSSFFVTSSLRSADGTVIGYRSIGRGPGLVVVHGALRDSLELAKLATELADSFTVHVMDRRGRGLSGPQGAGYSIEKECEDIDALLQATGASRLFGHSYGGLAALEAAARNDGIRKLALYEPGVSIGGDDWSWLSDYAAAMAGRQPRRAFASFVRGMGNTPLTRLPSWYARLILRIMIRGRHWKKNRESLGTKLQRA